MHNKMTMRPKLDKEDRQSAQAQNNLNLEHARIRIDVGNRGTQYYIIREYMAKNRGRKPTSKKTRWAALKN